MSDRQWVPRGGELDKPRWPWGGDLDTGKSGLSNFTSPVDVCIYVMDDGADYICMICVIS